MRKAKWPSAVAARGLRSVLLLAALLVACPTNALAQLGSWFEELPMPTARGWLGAADVSGILYAVGGATSACPTKYSVIEAYDPSIRQWQTKQPMPTARSHVAVGVVNGIIYVVGGIADCSGVYLATLEAYDPATDTWTTKSPMPTARHSPAAGVVNGILYVVGGRDNSQNWTGTVEAYDPATDRWTTKASMPTARGHLAAGVINGILYAAGGAIDTGGFVTAFATVEAFDPATNTWTTKSPMPTARWALGIGVADNRLYAVGGADAQEAPLAVTEMYDPSTGSWSGVAPMPTLRGWLAVGSATNALYVVGGSTCNLGAAAGCELTTSEVLENNTPAGTNVVVQPRDTSTGNVPVTLTFSMVTHAGDTTLATSNTGPTPPSGFQLGTPAIYYNLTTTATFSGNIAVCITYAGTTFSDPSQLTLQHYESGSWVNVTTNLDTAEMIVCGSVSSLSPFAVFQKLSPADVAIGKSGASTVKAGANLTYGIGVVNLGPNNATGVVVKDPVPAGTTFVSAQFAKGSCTVSSGKVSCAVSQPPAPCVFTSGIVTCNIGALAPFSASNPTGAEIELVVHVTAPRGVTITNTATVSASNPDPKSANNSAKAMTSVR